MAFKFNRSSKEPMSEINVTPFVDVMLVLLIIFMVTAPLLTVGVQVDLPESAADSHPDDQEPLTISINSKGEIFIQEHQVTYQKMVPKLFIHEEYSSSIIANILKRQKVALKQMNKQIEVYKKSTIEI